MTTAQTIIARALRMLGVTASGEVPTGAEASDALSVFNSLVQSLGLESLLVFSSTSLQIAFSKGQASTTIGPTGLNVTARPVRVLSTSYVLSSGFSYPLEVLNDADYNAIYQKDLTAGIPSAIYVDNSMPDTQIFLYPVPAQAVTLQLNYSGRLGTFLLNDPISLPDGYDRMFAYCLAAELAPEYGLQATPDILRGATNAKRVIKRMNMQVPVLDMPAGIPAHGGVGITGGRAGGHAIINTDGEFLVYTP
jgi:hypothetical protein